MRVHNIIRLLKAAGLLLLGAFPCALMQDLTPYVKEIGGTFCKYLAVNAQIPKKYNSECEEPTCHWDTWQDALRDGGKKAASSKVRYVLSYGHNGFGNQLWQHTVAFMFAESLKAKLLIAAIPNHMCPGGVSPPNTWAGMNTMERLLPPAFLYDKLPPDSAVRQLCENEGFYLADRPRDWRNSTYSKSFKQNLKDLITDPNPRCIRMAGYFQNLPLCADDVKRLWTPKMFTNFTMQPGENDISIYLRCLPRHYHFNDKHYYEVILNNTQFDKVWLFTAPECPTRLGPDPSRDNIVQAVFRMLYARFNATRWPSHKGTDDTDILLHDLAGLARSKKLILPVSSWAQWAGMLSNATEIHVNAFVHPTMPTMPQYVYHSDRYKEYFGKFNSVTKKIEFTMDLSKPQTKAAATAMAAPPDAVASQAQPKAQNQVNAENNPATAAVVATTTNTGTAASAAVIVGAGSSGSNTPGTSGSTSPATKLVLAGASNAKTKVHSLPYYPSNQSAVSSVDRVSSSGASSGGGAGSSSSSRGGGVIETTLPVTGIDRTSSSPRRHGNHTLRGHRGNHTRGHGHGHSHHKMPTKISMLHD